MTELIAEYVTAYGLFTLFGFLFFACLGIPAPASVVLLVGGAFVESGELPLVATFVVSFVSSVLGNQAGYFLGRTGGRRMRAGLWRQGRWNRSMKRAERYTAKWGLIGLFLSCWLITPLGPYVAIVCGINRIRWFDFSLVNAAGLLVWVVLYMWLGMRFSANLDVISTYLGRVSGVLAFIVAVVAIYMIFWRRGSGTAETDDLENPDLHPK